MVQYDLIVLGAGIFGLHAARYFSSKHQLKVAVIDTEQSPWRKASGVNQARVHSGYHYPRSMKTARMAWDNRARFLEEHSYAINSSFQKYYGVDRRGSLTSAEQFQRFCLKLDIPLTEAFRPGLFNHDMLEKLYLTEEYSFDPNIIRSKYLADIDEMPIDLYFGWSTHSVAKATDSWELGLSNKAGETLRLGANAVLNATYANINAVNRLFMQPTIPTTHEISELVLLYCPLLSDVGLTIMDGPYVSVMPFGQSGLHSASSVLYTHKAFSANDDPVFSCQEERADCTPQELRACTSCMFAPRKNTNKIVHHTQHYLSDSAQLFVHGRIATVKTKLKSALIDDGRPTDVQVFSQKPFYGCIFSGKVNSIYEVEEIPIDV